MSWASPSEFFAMGGYALYVWGSFGATALCIAIEMLSLRVRRNEALKAARLAIGASGSRS